MMKEVDISFAFFIFFFLAILGVSVSFVSAGPYGVGNSMDLSYEIIEDSIIYGYGDGVRYETSLKPKDFSGNRWAPEIKGRVLTDEREKELLRKKKDKIKINIDQRLTEKFKENNWVEVSVTLKESGGIYLKKPETPSLRKSVHERKKSLNKNVQSEVISSISSQGFNLKSTSSIGRGFIANITQGTFNRLSKDPDVLSIRIPERGKGALGQSLPIINTSEMWANGYTGKGQTICVIDSGINYTHPNLGGCSATSNISDGSCGKVIGGYDFVNDDADPMDDEGHGTHVAGIAAANGTVNGTAPNAKLVAVKVTDSSNTWILADLRDGIDWCNNNRDLYNISVITMSLGSFDLYDDAQECDQGILGASISNAKDNGIFVVAASGNDKSSTKIALPACASDAVSVGATYDLSSPWIWWKDYGCTDQNINKDDIACFTNRGNLLDFLAPGAVIDSTSVNGDLEDRSGTSMATPHVAGAAAILLEKRNDLTPDEIKNAFEDSGKEVGNWKRINILNASESLCVLGDWTNNSCGIGGCSAYQRFQNRTSSPSQCDVTARCEYDPTCLSGAEITVCSSGCNYTTIQSALDNAASGDTISVTDGGTYNEDINWSTSDDHVTLDCGGATIDSSYEAITIDNMTYAVIINCIFNSTNGVLLTGDGTRHSFYNNMFDVEEKGLESMGADGQDTGSLDIADNIFINSPEEAALYFHGEAINSSPGNSYIARNTFLNNLYAISLRKGTDNIIVNNTIQGGSYGIYLRGSGYNSYNTIDGNNISGADTKGIYMTDQTDIDLVDNRVCLETGNDIEMNAGSTGTGTNNSCDNAVRWNDTGFEGCTNYCQAPPVTLLLDPLNEATYDTVNDVNIACHSSGSYGLENVTLYHNLSGSWQSNQTSDISGYSNTTTFTITVANGTSFYWNCLTHDNKSQGTFADNNWTTTVIVDNTPPQVSISSPLNQTYDSSSIDFNISIGEVGNCDYSLDGGATNITMDSSDGISFSSTNSSMDDGGYRANFYCQDALGNKNHSEYVDFNILTVQVPPRLEVSLVDPSSNATVDIDQFFSFTSQVCCYDSNCGEVNVSLDPESHEYSPTTETHCVEGVCNRIIYPGLRFVQEDGEWKKIEKARSLKGAWNAVIDEDPDFPVEIIDFNYTSIVLDLKVSERKMNKNIDLKVYNRNNKSEKPRDISGNIKSKDKKMMFGSKNEVKRQKIDLSDTAESILAQEIKWGDNSTIIKLQEPDVENLDDSYTREASPNSNYGSQTYLRSLSSFSGYAHYVFLKFNLSDIPENSEILDSTFALYLFDNNFDTPTEGQSTDNYYVYSNFSWNEESITFNNMPNENESSPLYDDFVDFNGSSPLGWYFWNVTSISRDANNFSVYMAPGAVYDSPSNTDYLQFYSKEYSANVTRRPYLNVTYRVNDKNGLVSTTTGDTPFYTTDINPHNVSLDQNSCTNITWQVNATGNLGGAYEFFVFANKTSNLSISNITDKIYITIEQLYDSVLEVVDPSSLSPLNVSSSDNITAQFNFSIDGQVVNDSLTINNITVGGVHANVIGTSDPGGSYSILFEDWEDGWENKGAQTCDSTPDCNSIGDFNGCDNNGNDYRFCSSDDTNPDMSYNGARGGVVEDWDAGTETSTNGIWYNFDASTACGGGVCDYIEVSSWNKEIGLDANEYCWVIEQDGGGTPSTLYSIDSFFGDTWTQNMKNLTVSMSSTNVSVRIICDMTSTSDDVYWDDFNITGHKAASAQQELWYASDRWNVNVTVPSGLNGYQNLFINVTNGTVEGSGIETSAVHYD